jgi:NADH:ubiquinone oxidoreductase subunit 5 (subunit L)/multisubunit Na+/H+ antiporter MnhA subunit
MYVTKMILIYSVANKIGYMLSLLGARAHVSLSHLSEHETMEFVAL